MSIARKVSKDTPYITRLRNQMEQYNEICDNPECEYQDNCCYWCDVCAMWYSKDEPCMYH